MTSASGIARMSPSLAQFMQPMRFCILGYASSAKSTSATPAKLTGSAIWSGVKLSPPCNTHGQSVRVPSAVKFAGHHLSNFIPGY